MATIVISAAAYAEIQAALKEMALEANIGPAQLIMDGIILEWSGDPVCVTPLLTGGATTTVNAPGAYPYG